MSTLLLDASVILAAFDSGDIHHDASTPPMLPPRGRASVSSSAAMFAISSHGALPFDRGTSAKPRRGLIGLGSNVGDRRARLQAAVDALPSVGVRVTAASSVYDTDAVGEVLDQPSFLNACILIETSLAPLELLDAVKRLEAELGRAAGGPRHGPRAIDIDILLLGDIELLHERMTLPHEQVLARRFVLIPALELDFELATPDGRRLSDALAVLPVSEGVRWAGPPLSP